MFFSTKKSFLFFSQASIRKYACWFDIYCLLQQENPDLDLTDFDLENVTDSQQQQINSLILLVTQVRGLMCVL